MKRLVLALAAAMLMVLLAVAWVDRDPEWAQYEREYLALGQPRAQSESQSAWYRSQGVEIRQIAVPALQRVDRCTTCHLAVADPNFAGAPEPLRMHSGILARHPSERFGCTACHGGEGRAVTLLAAHGQVPGSTTRMLRGQYLQAACYGCHAEETLEPAMTSEIAAGQLTINQFNCLRCHQLEGKGESEGPDLSAIGSRRDAVELYAHLLDPSATTPGSTMPIFPLTRAQLQAVVIYLLAARGDGQAVQDVRYRMDAATSESGSESTPGTLSLVSLPETPAILFSQYNGGELYWGLGCGVCHRYGSAGGSAAPALTFIGRTRNRDWLRRYLQDPSAVRPDARMPQLYLNDREIDALVEFLAK